MAQPLTMAQLKEPILKHARREFTTLRSDQTVGEALESLRRQELGERIVYFYVLDKDDRLLGVVPVRRLLTSRLDAPLASLMVGPAISVPETASVLEACEQFVEHRLLALPVVDAEGRLKAVADVHLFTDEVFTVARQRQLDHIFQMIGVHVAFGRRVSAWSGFRSRFPWLLCNIASGLACAFIAGAHEGLIGRFTLLALFMAVVLALAESVSMQSMTVMLQGLDREGNLWRRAWGTVRREFLTAALLGLGSGALVGGTAWAWRGDIAAAAVVGLSIGLAMVTACVLGVVFPTLVRALRADPKIATGPLVLAASDVATLLFYFGAAEWLLR